MLVMCWRFDLVCVWGGGESGQHSDPTRGLPPGAGTRRAARVGRRMHLPFIGPSGPPAYGTAAGRPRTTSIIRMAELHEPRAEKFALVAQILQFASESDVAQ